MPRAKAYNQFPRDSALGDQSLQALDWVVTQLNQIVGQGVPPPFQGLPSVQNNIVNPTTGQITSLGSRMSSVTTAIAFVATTTTITLFWDGTNGSQVFMVGRDDGSVYGPNPAGSPLKITGLVASTNYWLYGYFDEVQSVIRFATNAKAVGSPALAFTAPNFNAAQQQIMRGHIPLGLLMVTTGISTPGSGSSSGSGGSGGGGAGAGGNRGSLIP